ncbi:hypothetical protein TSOC_000641 [Tetrabaena socialis]|uniref:DUF726 domain-containing protein n=1 Tax=Tetrabaena socialis TaxID=47790 RepID=A0A2J8AIN4_9CHLO|nr:hypothetical protein TSOC_000641 [Tetrabaena socialis]|eukprot:PNH12377.1 hypothetical protein TSOC_000641 [Tetrabaena socialis]
MQHEAVEAPGGPPTRLLSAHRDDATAATAVLFFEGDQISPDDYEARELIGDLAEPAQHLSTLSTRFSEDAVFVVLPTTLNRGQACYGNFLNAMTATGEPLGFKPQGYRSSTHLHDILTRCCGAAQAAGLTLVGFSKGAVVLNQLLTEMAWHEEALSASGPAELQPAPAGQAPASSLAAAPAQAGAGGTAAGVAGASPVRPTAVAPPLPSAHGVSATLDAVRVVHFLDAGLNCRGVHLTDPAVLTMLGLRHKRRPLAVHLHGTPRQWGDRKRPWIVQERDRFLALLRGAGVPVEVHAHFEGQPPSLRQHFEVISLVGRGAMMS